MALLKSRANAKATPDAVFAACALLEVSKPDYRNDDVLAITGGGMSVVAPLVKLYKSHQATIKSCAVLDPAITITLIENLSKSIATQKAQADKAIAELMNSAEKSITEIADINGSLTATIENNETKITELETTIRSLKEELATEKESNRIAQAELTNLLAAAKQNERSIESLKTTHEEKLVAIADRHTLMLADALEKQRKTLEVEKADALAKNEMLYNQQLAAANSEIEIERSIALALREHSATLEAALKQSDIEKDAARATQEEIRRTLENQINEGRNQLREAQEVYQQVMTALTTEKEAQALMAVNNINTVTLTAESFDTKLTEIVSKINSLLDSK